jgi:putative transposase
MIDDDLPKQWHHAPAHLFVPGAAYMITARTYGESRLFDAPEKLDYLQGVLFGEASTFGWQLQAWAVLANHYHLVALAPEDAKSLQPMIRAIHSRTAIWINKRDGVQGRKVWFQYRDTCLTYEKSYLARLHYVHANPVKHGLVKLAEQYRWCSMAWFLEQANPGFQKTVFSFKIDKLSIEDDF